MPELKEAIFAAGCFWGVEDTFAKVDGVDSTEVGYIGGENPDPSYEEVCSGRSGHAEAIRLKFDPQVVTYKQLLDTFFDCHNPTALNRQGWDVGSQYRSEIFYTSELQRDEAEAMIKELNDKGKYQFKIVTEVSEAGQFFRAEEYHQNYYEKTGQRYC